MFFLKWYYEIIAIWWGTQREDAAQNVQDDKGTSMSKFIKILFLFCVCVFVNLYLFVVFLAAPCSMRGLSSSVQFSTLVVSNPLQPPWTVARQASLSISNS